MSEFLLPDFVGIGGHRCGSSWLWKNLREHPSVWTPTAKELHFFDRKLKTCDQRFVQNRALVRLYYRRFFAKSAGHFGAVRGEFTPAYSTLDAEGVKFVRNIIPRSCFLFMMRHPVDRGWSHLRKDIPQALATKDPLSREKAIRSFIESPGFRSRMDYAATLDRWFRFFAEDKFQILFFETAVADPLQTLTAAWQFVGVDPSASVISLEEATKKVNARDLKEMDNWLYDYLHVEYAPMVSRLRSDFGLAPPWENLG